MITIPAQLESISTRKDGTMRVAFGTQELPPSVAGDLFSMQNKICYLCIKPEPFRNEELKLISELEASDDNFKSPSQRMRGVLFRLFEQNNEGYKTFTLYYDSKMEQFINHLKSKIL